MPTPRAASLCRALLCAALLQASGSRAQELPGECATPDVPGPPTHTWCGSSVTQFPHDASTHVRRHQPVHTEMIDRSRQEVGVPGSSSPLCTMTSLHPPAFPGVPAAIVGTMLEVMSLIPRGAGPKSQVGGSGQRPPYIYSSTDSRGSLGAERDL